MQTTHAADVQCGFYSHFQSPARLCALLQKQKHTALLNVALEALEERQTAASAALRPATYGNASMSGGQDGLTAIAKAETELVQAQEALVTADERARDSSTAYQTTARYGMPCLGYNTCSFDWPM